MKPPVPPGYWCPRCRWHAEELPAAELIVDPDRLEIGHRPCATPLEPRDHVHAQLVSTR